MMRQFQKKNMTVLLLLILFSFGFLESVKADESGSLKLRTIRVQGEGNVKAVPDQVEMQFEVQEEGTRSEEVSAKVVEKMKTVFRAVKSFGVLDKDFKTVRYNIQPKYKYDKGESQRTGFIVSNRISLVLKKVDDAGKVLDAVTKAGVSQVDGPNFGFSDPSKLKIEALKAAVADATAKAEALAQASGSELGKVFSIAQISTGMPQPRPVMMRMAASVSTEEVPVAKGEDEVTAQVEVVYLLK